jgi:hypothetical protein
MKRLKASELNESMCLYKYGLWRYSGMYEKIGALIVSAFSSKI